MILDGAQDGDLDLDGAQDGVLDLDGAQVGDQVIVLGGDVVGQDLVGGEVGQDLLPFVLHLWLCQGHPCPSQDLLCLFQDLRWAAIVVRHEKMEVA